VRSPSVSTRRSARPPRSCWPGPGTGCPPTSTRTTRVVVTFKCSGKFGTRYSTLEFQDAAHLDDGEVWAVSFALPGWSPAIEQKVTELMKAAVS
jgi:hypothetical protein